MKTISQDDQGDKRLIVGLVMVSFVLAGVMVNTKDEVFKKIGAKKREEDKLKGFLPQKIQGFGEKTEKGNGN